MYFILYLSFEGLSFGDYGPIISNPETDPHIKYYRLENDWDDVDLFERDMNEINLRCESLLGYGDLDYFDAEKCLKLKEWIDERLQEPAVPRYQEILSVLRDYCNQAEKLNTGVIIDL